MTILDRVRGSNPRATAAQGWNWPHPLSSVFIHKQQFITENRSEINAGLNCHRLFWRMMAIQINSEFLASRWEQKTLKCHCVRLVVAAQPEEVISSHVILNTFIEPVNCSKHWKQRMGFICQVLNLFTGESGMLCVCLLWVVLCTRRDCALWRGFISAVGVRSSIPLIPPSQMRFFIQPIN